MRFEVKIEHYAFSLSPVRSSDSLAQEVQVPGALVTGAEDGVGALS